MGMLKSINPSNYHALGEVSVSTLSEIANKVKLAQNAKEEWREIGVDKRISLLRTAFKEFEKRKTEIALLESREMGMPLNEALADFDGALDLIGWYFNNAQKYLDPETTYENNKEIHQVFCEPIGVVAVIIPWNFPFNNFVWGAMQSLIAGNTIVLKHSEECPLSGELIEDVLSKYLPKGVFNEVYGDGETGKNLIGQDIDMIAFTGSTKTGGFLYKEAGKKFIKAVMELGGSAPGIIFDDADIASAIEGVCDFRLYNTGQCCDGLKRLIVHEKVIDEVADRVSSIFKNKKIGNAEEKSTEIGPVVSKRQLDLLADQIEDARANGAKVVTGGSSLEKKLGGAFIEPTVLTGVTNKMRVWREEVFGPVLPVVKFKTEAEAIKLANQTAYGLGAYVFTQDKEKADRTASVIESGMVSINGIEYVKPCNPFGGYKKSGFGREHGKYGFHEVTQIKIVARNK